MGPDGIVAEVERRDELRVRQEDVRRRLLQRDARVGEWELALEVLTHPHEEVLAEAAVGADRSLQLAVAEGRLTRSRVGSHEHGRNVALGLGEERRAWLEEP